MILSSGLLACGDDDDGDGPGIDAGVERRLVVFYTNDEHSNLFGFAPESDDFPVPTAAGTGEIKGGIARRAKVLRAERAATTAAGVDSVTVSAGDETQGTLAQIAFTTTAPDFTMMEDLGYDVMTPGNHEFDLGPLAYASAINAAMAGGGLPQIVATNIKFDPADEGDDALAALFGEGDSDKPIKRYHVVTTASGIKVGFFGVMGIEAAGFAPLKLPVRFSAPLGLTEGNVAANLPLIYADIEPTIATLRNVEKVDVVVMVSHAGVSLIDEDVSEDLQIARHVNGIDLIVSGHSHTLLPEPIVATAPDGHEVPIVQAGAYGTWLGRLELVLEPGQRPRLETDAGKTKLFPIDDRIVGDDPSILAALTELIDSLESEGAPVVDDPEVTGDLYFRPVGSTDFDVDGSARSKETNILNLSTDAMMAAAWELAGPTQVAINASGSVRGDIFVGSTGDMTLADLYRIFPLGVNPVDGSVGYPLIRTFIWKAELKGAFEIAVSTGLVADAYFLTPSGARVEIDTSRPAWDPGSPLDADNGRVTKITLDPQPDDDVEEYTEVIFDVNADDPWQGSFTDQISVVTSWYVGSFAAAAGVTLKDEAGNPITLEQAYLLDGDAADVKEYEAFIRYIQEESEANGGKLPSRYDATSEEGSLPRRMICTGPLCPE
jgi:2',3'-cyclic-nucleotide 2'-phosphodiesterase (5'-nucleotidase family)